MREEFKERKYKYVKVTGIIGKFGEYRFDGHDTILAEDPETGLINPIRRTDGSPYNTMYHLNQTTLIVEATVDGELVGDGHLWISEDLNSEAYGYDIGDKINIYGNIEVYKKGDTYDFCVNPQRYEKCND